MKPSERRRREMQSAQTKGRVAIDENGQPILFQRKSKRGYAIKELRK